MMGYFDDEGTGHDEMSFDRQYFGLEGKRTASIGVKLMDGNNGWNCIGILPQASAQGLSHHGQAPMAVISLP